MNKDNRLILEALHSKFTQATGAETYVSNQLQMILKSLENMSTAIHLSKSSHVDQLLSRVIEEAEMLMSERGSGTSEDAENEDTVIVYAENPAKPGTAHGTGDKLKVADAAVKYQLNAQTIRQSLAKQTHAVMPGNNKNYVIALPMGTPLLKPHAENAEHASLSETGAIGDITAIQKVLIAELKKHGFQLNKVSNAHAEQEGGPVVFMGRKQGFMHNIVEISPMGLINGEPYKEYLAELKANAEDAEGVSAAFHYDPMPGLDKAAHQIREILQGAANDEVRTEHIIKMAQIILGSPKDYAAAEYRKMLDGLIVLLNRFIVVPMN